MGTDFSSGANRQLARIAQMAGWVLWDGGPRPSAARFGEATAQPSMPPFAIATIAKNLAEGIDTKLIIVP